MKYTGFHSEQRYIEGHGVWYSQDTLPSLLSALALMVLFANLVGCTSLNVLSDAEKSAINAGEKTVVLLRIECTIDNQPYEPFRASMWTGEPVVALGIGGFETVGEPRLAAHGFLSEDSRRAGWTYFALSSGVYYLAVLGPESDAGIKNIREAPRWRVDVPENTRLLYIGTLPLAGRADGTFLLGGKIIKPANNEEFIVKNEHELAKSLLAEHFPGGGEMKTSKMQRWRQGDPIIIRTPRPDSGK
ncbi:MAG TPA: hypothetical protein PLX02_00630 [Syntrophorhabdaceae bacterium]|nr:hypothetical protein [Syntrophorhabdaceae bacterium]HQM80104.1 hypothetical protein [Syntrophorhabdaceae bacterium]